MEALLNIADVTVVLSLSRSAVYELLRREAFPAPKRIGRRVLWRKSDIEGWIEAGCPQCDQDSSAN